MKKGTKKGEEIDNLITLSEAARLRNVTHEAVRRLVKKGRLRSRDFYGRILVYRDEVLAFEKRKPGRRSKQ